MKDKDKRKLKAEIYEWMLERENKTMCTRQGFRQEREKLNKARGEKCRKMNGKEMKKLE